MNWQEKELLLLDLENANSDIDRKYKKLDTIIVYYLDDQPSPSKTPHSEPKDTPNSDDNDEKVVEGDVDEKVDETEENEETVENEEILEDLSSSKKEDLLPQEIKNIYRKIMMKTHPDKNRGKVTDEYDEYYKNAVKSKNDNDKAEILFIAYKLNITEVFDVDEEHFGNIRYKIKTLEMKSTQIDNNPFWIWYHTQNKSLKNIMIQQITKMRTKR